MDELRTHVETPIAQIIEDVLLARRVYDDGATVPPRASEDARRVFLVELVTALTRADDEPAFRASLPAADALGAEWHAAKGTTGELAREITRLSRHVTERLEERGLIDRVAAARLGALADEALARALDAYAAAGRTRLDGWLSFFAHEMRNPLNTLVNALWIIRNSENVTQIQRISDMADRAVKRLEGYIKDMRDLEAKLADPSPRKPGSSNPPAP